MIIDSDFFEELRNINQSDLGSIVTDSIRPKVSELRSGGQVSYKFPYALESLVKKLHQKRSSLAFNADFIAYPRHICSFPNGRAFRRQLNIGIFAGETVDDDGIRFGFGFSINRALCRSGVDEFNNFMMKIITSRNHFDRFFCEIGGYAEPEMLRQLSPMSKSILQQAPDLDGDWRFFGRWLSWRDNEYIICNIDLLVDEMIRVFDLIEKSKYWCLSNRW